MLCQIALEIHLSQEIYSDIFWNSVSNSRQWNKWNTCLGRRRTHAHPRTHTHTYDTYTRHTQDTLTHGTPTHVTHLHTAHTHTHMTHLHTAHTHTHMTHPHMWHTYTRHTHDTYTRHTHDIGPLTHVCTVHPRTSDVVFHMPHLRQIYHTRVGKTPYKGDSTLLPRQQQLYDTCLKHYHSHLLALPLSRHYQHCPVTILSVHIFTTRCSSFHYDT